jgi:glycosyltransferase involved in cell wall biosynthesis
LIKIVHLITDLNIGGAEMMLYKLISRINRELFQSVVVSLRDIGLLGVRIKELGIPVCALSMQRGIPNPSGLWRLLKILRTERPQILQTWLYHADLLGLLAGKLARIPAIVWNVRCSYMDMKHYSRLSSLVLRVLTKLSPFPDAIIANSEAGRIYHEHIGYSPKRWEIIPNGFDLNIFHPDPEARIKFRDELGLSINSLLIGFIARYDPMKDHKNFLQAVSILVNERFSHENVYFVLVGHGVDQNNSGLMRTIETLAIKKLVFLMGERNDIPNITAALDVASSSSSYGEAFPNAIGEAMACGVPCVVTDVGDSAWIIGNTGRIVPPKNPRALAESWKELIDLKSEQRQELGRLARQRIAENFSLDTIVHKYEALYQEIINKGKVSK